MVTPEGADVVRNMLAHNVRCGHQAVLVIEKAHQEFRAFVHPRGSPHSHQLRATGAYFL